ncbi:hypothetical protein, partial [Segatella maculosa]|uniref:hypothetical protein n=1 Tax=Segatella maculosa TaxID=439703 RepID=UPI002492DFDB
LVIDAKIDKMCCSAKENTCFVHQCFLIIRKNTLNMCCNSLVMVYLKYRSQESFRLWNAQFQRLEL